MKKTFFQPAVLVLGLAVLSSPVSSLGQSSVLMLPIEEYNQIAVQHPNFAPVYFERGMAQFSIIRDYSAAIQDLSKAIQLRPNDAAAHYMRGASQLASGQLDQAVADLDKAAALEKNMFVEIYKMRGNLYLTRAYFRENGDHLADAEAAIKNFDEIVRLNPDSSEAWYNRGRGYFAKAYFSENSYKQAIADFDKALSLDPNFEAAQNERESALRHEQLRNGEIDLY